MSRSWVSGSRWARWGWGLFLPRFPVRDHVMSGGDRVSARVIWRVGEEVRITRRLGFKREATGYASFERQKGESGGKKKRMDYFM